MNYTDYSRLSHGFGGAYLEPLGRCECGLRRTHRDNLVSDTLARNLLCGRANRYRNGKNSELDAYPIASNPQTMRLQPSTSSLPTSSAITRVLPSFLGPPAPVIGSSSAWRILSPPSRMSSSLIFSTTRPISTRRQLKKWEQERLSGLLSDSSYRRQLKKWGFGQQELFKEVNTESMVIPWSNTSLTSTAVLHILQGRRSFDIPGCWRYRRSCKRYGPVVNNPRKHWLEFSSAHTTPDWCGRWSGCQRNRSD